MSSANSQVTQPFQTLAGLAIFTKPSVSPGHFTKALPVCTGWSRGFRTLDRVRKKPKAQRREIRKSQASDWQRGLGQEAPLPLYRAEQRNCTFRVAKRPLSSIQGRAPKGTGVTFPRKVRGWLGGKDIYRQHLWGNHQMKGTAAASGHQPAPFLPLTPHHQLQGGPLVRSPSQSWGPLRLVSRCLGA